MADQLPKLLCVVGARPNFMKIAPLMDAMRANQALAPFLLHTGQHYDAAMKAAFFDQLAIPEPDVDLNVGSGSHAVQTAQVMERFEPVLDRVKPLAVLVVGDVNSTIACSLVAAKKQVPVIHVEAGLRSFDRTMPEEINRVLTDQIADLLFTTERAAKENLLREGIDADKIHFVGNVMIDALRRNLDKAVPPHRTIGAYSQDRWSDYAVLTLHRPANVDDREILRRLLDTIREISAKIPVVFPIHPRTAKQIESYGLQEWLADDRIVVTPPLGYLEMLGLVGSAKLVLTDSGGLQEETTALGVACLTLRENTERPITVSEGTNTLVGRDPARIVAGVDEILTSGGKQGRLPELWDGHAAQRIVEIIHKTLLGER